MEKLLESKGKHPLTLEHNIAEYADDTTHSSKFERVSDMLQQLELPSKL